MAIGLLLRLPIAAYAGRPTQYAFNAWTFLHHPWSYSDIASLYFRDHLGVRHRVPYFGYRLEYPVLTGGLIWLLSTVNATVWAYFVASAAALGAMGLALVRILGRVCGSNPWLLALSPALALYAALNWDLLALALLAGALVLFDRDRHAGSGALLALATGAKLFPAVLLPFMLAVRLRERRRRDASILLGVFAAVIFVVNVPVALQSGSRGLVIRPGWKYFFDFNRDRPRAVNVWNLLDSLHLTTAQINLYSGVLAVLGVAAVLALFVRANARAALLAPALVAALGWVFFVNKVYSPQYTLWVVVALALAGAPVALVVALSAVDIGYFASSFAWLHLNSQWYFNHFLVPSGLLREAVLLGICGWAVARLARPPSAVVATEPARG